MIGWKVVEHVSSNLPLQRDTSPLRDTVSSKYNCRGLGVYKGDEPTSIAHIPRVVRTTSYFEGLVYKLTCSSTNIKYGLG